MKSGLAKKYISLLLAAGISTGAIPSFAADTDTASEINPDTVLWYDEYARDNMNVVMPPSDSWAANAKWDYEEVRALPVGNGRLGAMVYGRTDTEHLQINENTVWSGGPHNYANTLETPLTKDTIDSSLKDVLDDGEILATTAEVYEKASELVLEDRTDEATALIDMYFLGDERYQTSYQPFVDLWLDFGHDFSMTENYSRMLDIENATATVGYDYDGIRYRRETIASYPDQVIATNITAESGGSNVKKLSFTATLDSQQNYTVQKKSENELQLQGVVNSSGGLFINSLPNAVHFDARVIIDTDGTVKYEENSLKVSDASYATVYVTGGTNYIDYKTLAGYETDENGNIIMESCDDEAAFAYAAARSEAVKNHIADKSYEDIKESHLADYKSLYERSQIEFSGDSKDDETMYRTTDERIAVFDGYNDLSLVKLYFNYGKYLLISSSRSTDVIEEEFDNLLPSGQPSNLQGIWSWKKDPGWGSKYTANINVQMNYFMAQTANLPETELTLFDALEELAESGKRTAKIHYGMENPDAWVLHHNFDIWRGTAPVDLATSGMWPTGGAWLANHIWEYYEFTGDEEFLRERAYPVLKGSAEFFEEYLKEYTDPASGSTWLVSPASISPEHGNVQLSPTMDNSLILNVLNISADAAELLGTDSDKVQLWREMAEKIPPYQLNESGTYLREWLVDGVDEKTGDAQHRHPSQLWGLHPGTDVTPYDNSDEEQAIFDGFVNALERRGEGATGWSVAWRVCMWARAARGDKAYSQMISLIKKATAPNLFDMHPDDIFQIDGNLGGAAGIIEMLMQSTEEDITILPALPAQWRSGAIKGLKARGAHEVDMSWTDGNAKEAVVKAGKSGDITVRYIKGVENAVVTDESGKVITSSVSDNKQKITFSATEGNSYTITGFTETEYEPYVFRETVINDTMDTDEQVESYEFYDKTLGKEIQHYGDNIIYTSDNGWNDNNGVRKDITQYIKSGREYEISVDAKHDWYNTDGKLFLEIFDANGELKNTISVASGQGTNGDVYITLSGSAVPEFSENESVYLCITHPCGYQIYDNVVISYEPTGADVPINTPTPEEEVDTSLEYLYNGDMEGSTGIGDTPYYWGARGIGDSDSVKAVSDSDAHGGNYSLLLQNRASASSAVEYYLDNTNEKLVPGRTYIIGIWVKPSADDTVNLKMRYDYWDDDVAVELAVKKDEWTYVSGAYTVRENGNLTQLIIDTENSAADLRLDDATLKAMGTVKNIISVDVSDDGSYSVTIPSGLSGDLYVAAYSTDGVLTAISTDREGQFTDAAYIKAYLWMSGSMMPASDAVRIER